MELAGRFTGNEEVEIVQFSEVGGIDAGYFASEMNKLGPLSDKNCLFGAIWKVPVVGNSGYCY